MLIERIDPEVLREITEGAGFNNAERRLCYLLSRGNDGVKSSPEQVKGLRVLDLASGSGLSYDGVDRWSPHFSRVCALNGAEVVAVDINPQTGFDETLFEWIQADLVEAVRSRSLGRIPGLQGKRFDIVHSAAFVGENFCTDLLEQLDEDGLGDLEFEKAFLREAGKLLTEGGTMTIDEHDLWSPILYTRKGRDIIRIA